MARIGASAETDLGRKIKTFLRSEISKLVDRRRVLDVLDDGRVVVTSHDPETRGSRPLRALRSARVAEGDDVVTLQLGGGEFVLGALGARDRDDLIVLSSSGVSRRQTASLTELTLAINRDYTLGRGSWDVSMLVSASGRRDVTTGSIALVAAFGEIRSEIRPAYDALAGDGYLPIAMTVNGRIDVSSEAETLALSIGFRGHGTAGTTWCYMPTVFGVARRVG